MPIILPTQISLTIMNHISLCEVNFIGKIAPEGAEEFFPVFLRCDKNVLNIGITVTSDGVAYHCVTTSVKTRFTGLVIEKDDKFINCFKFEKNFIGVGKFDFTVNGEFLSIIEREGGWLVDHLKFYSPPQNGAPFTREVEVSNVSYSSKVGNATAVTAKAAVTKTTVAVHPGIKTAMDKYDYAARSRSSIPTYVVVIVESVSSKKEFKITYSTPETISKKCNKGNSCNSISCTGHTIDHYMNVLRDISVFEGNPKDYNYQLREPAKILLAAYERDYNNEYVDWKEVLFAALLATPTDGPAFKVLEASSN